MIDRVEKPSKGSAGDCRAVFRCRAVTVTLPQRRSGQSRSVDCRALSSTAGHPKTSNRRFALRAIAVSHCRCGAAGTTGPAARCAPGSSSISAA
jgi:hypothetical protein